MAGSDFMEKRQGRDMEMYDLMLACMNCGKRFSQSLPVGCNARGGNLPYGIYLHDGKDYRKLNGRKHWRTEYIRCPVCRSESVAKSDDGIDNKFLKISLIEMIIIMMIVSLAVITLICILK
jgi:DNA-directed RNA polymerase subunit RPC12/RpoP